MKLRAFSELPYLTRLFLLLARDFRRYICVYCTRNSKKLQLAALALRERTSGKGMKGLKERSVVVRRERNIRQIAWMGRGGATRRIRGIA